MGKRNASPYPWAFWRRLAVVQDHGPRPRHSALSGWVEAVIGDFGWAEERATRDRLTDAVASGSVDGRQVALRELSRRVRALQTFEVPA